MVIVAEQCRARVPRSGNASPHTERGGRALGFRVPVRRSSPPVPNARSSCTTAACVWGGSRVRGSANRKRLLHAHVPQARLQAPRQRNPDWLCVTTSVTLRDPRGQLDVKVEPEGLVELTHDPSWKTTEGGSQTLDCNRTHVLRLCLGVDLQAGLGCWNEDLEREDPRRATRERNDRDHASPQALGNGIRLIVADDNGRASLVGLAALRRLKIKRGAPHLDASRQAVASHCFP